jgi:hypothetical protein
MTATDFFDWLKGKRTYILGVTVVLLGLLQGLDVFVVPEWIWGILGGMGLVTIRAGVNEVSDVVKRNGTGTPTS